MVLEFRCGTIDAARYDATPEKSYFSLVTRYATSITLKENNNILSILLYL